MPLASLPRFAYQTPLAVTHRARKGRTKMPRTFPIVVVLVAACAAMPAAATWLTCGAVGTDAAGAFAVQTTSADVGALPPDRLDALKQRLAAYVAKADAGAKISGINCNTFDDVVQVNSTYSQAINATSRRYGWDHFTVVHPDEWLAAKDIVADPSRP